MHAPVSPVANGGALASLPPIGSIVGRGPSGLGPSNGTQPDRHNRKKIANVILIVKINFLHDKELI